MKVYNRSNDNKYVSPEEILKLTGNPKSSLKIGLYRQEVMVSGKICDWIPVESIELTLGDILEGVIVWNGIKYTVRYNTELNIWQNE